MTEAFHLASTLQQLLVILYFYIDLNLRFVNQIINNTPKDCVNQVKRDVHKKAYESNPKLKCTCSNKEMNGDIHILVIHLLLHRSVEFLIA